MVHKSIQNYKLRSPYQPETPILAQAKKRSVRASLSAGEIEFLINVSLRLISGVTISSNSLKEAISILRKFFNPFGSSADNSWIREWYAPYYFFYLSTVSPIVSQAYSFYIAEFRQQLTKCKQE